MFQQDAFASLPLGKVSRNDDDERSTVSGASSDPLSLPSSPCKVWPATPGKTCMIAPATLADLPSLGSLGHFAGQCSRCCFFPKGRCQNGYDCRFCHFEHDKRQRKKKIMVRGNPVARWQQEHGQLPPDQVYQQFEQMPPAPVPQQVFTSSGPCLAPPIMAPPAGPVLPMQGQLQSVESWSVESVVDWLTYSGLGHLSRSFEEHRITGDILLELSPSDLEEIGIHAVGDKKRFLRATSQLQGPPLPTLQAPPPPPTPPPYPQIFSDLGPCQPYMGQQPFSAPVPNFLASSSQAW